MAAASAFRPVAASPAGPERAVVAVTVVAAVVLGAASGIDPRYGVALAFGAAFVAVVLSDLLLGVAAVVLFAYLETYATVGSFSLAKLAGALVVVAWVAALAGGRRPRNLLAERPALAWLLVVFLGWAAISTAWAAIEPAAFDSVQRYALNLVLVPVTYAALRAPRDVVRLLAVIVAGATVAAITGLASGADATTADAARATGTVGDANELAAGVLVGLAVATAFALNRHVAVPWRLVSGGAALLCLAALLSTLSRGGLIGLGAALVCAVLLAGRWRGRALTGAAVVALAGTAWFALLAPLPATERVLDVSGGTGRMDLWTVAQRMVDAHPVQGVGTGQFATSSVSYLLEPGAIERGDFILTAPKVAHNTYLGVAAELGLVGGALFLAIVLVSGGCLLRAIRELRRRGDERLELLARGLAAGLGGYLVTLLFISENYSKLMWALIAIGPALLAVARSRPEGHEP